MKKFMVMMVVVGSVAFGRDNSFNAQRDIDVFVNTSQQISSVEKSTRETTPLRDNISNFGDFHRDLELMDRGHEDR